MYETLEIVPDIGVPLPSKYSYTDLRKRVEAACNSAAYLKEEGATYGEPTRQEKEDAAALVSAYAADEDKASRSINNKKIGRMRTEAVVYAASILDEYGHKVAENASQIRNLITTKLIAETENADPRIRLKALEMLGKISDVGLFSEKTEVTVTHQTSDELKAKLKGKLEKLINPQTSAKADPKDIEQDDEFAQIKRIAEQEVVEADYEEVDGE